MGVDKYCPTGEVRKKYFGRGEWLITAHLTLMGKGKSVVLDVLRGRFLRDLAVGVYHFIISFALPSLPVPAIGFCRVWRLRVVESGSWMRSRAGRREGAI